MDQNCDSLARLVKESLYDSKNLKHMEADPAKKRLPSACYHGNIPWNYEMEQLEPAVGSFQRIPCLFRPTLISKCSLIDIKDLSAQHQPFRKAYWHSNKPRRHLWGNAAEQVSFIRAPSILWGVKTWIIFTVNVINAGPSQVGSVLPF